MIPCTCFMYSFNQIFCQWRAQDCSVLLGREGLPGPGLLNLNNLPIFFIQIFKSDKDNKNVVIFLSNFKILVLSTPFPLRAGLLLILTSMAVNEIFFCLLSARLSLVLCILYIRKGPLFASAYSGPVYVDLVVLKITLCTWIPCHQKHWVNFLLT